MQTPRSAASGTLCFSHAHKPDVARITVSLFILLGPGPNTPRNPAVPKSSFAPKRRFQVRVAFPIEVSSALFLSADRDRRRASAQPCVEAIRSLQISVPRSEEDSLIAMDS